MKRESRGRGPIGVWKDLRGKQLAGCITTSRVSTEANGQGVQSIEIAQCESLITAKITRLAVVAKLKHVTNVLRGHLLEDTPIPFAEAMSWEATVFLLEA
jgi:hypothetical protein